MLALTTLAASDLPAIDRPFAVATDNMIATREATKVLEQGGSAADATVVAQLVLTLVEPQSSGIGGGAFTLYWDNQQQSLITFDGREVAPLKAKEDYFHDEQDQPLPWSYETVRSAKSVGVPGTLALLKQLHDKHGLLPWNDLLERAIQIALMGYPLDKKIHRNLLFAHERGFDHHFSTAYNFYFQKDGSPKNIGTTLKNPEFAQTLRTIQIEGVEAFYGGSIAHSILDAVRAAPGQSKPEQQLELEDFKQYQVKLRQPVCSPYRSYMVCGMGPPSSGALTIGQILSMLQHFDMQSVGHSPEGIHLFLEASKLAYADRGRYMADSDFVDIPVKGLLDQNYLHQRTQLIAPDNTIPAPTEPGSPPSDHIALFTSDTQPEHPSTSHFNIIDSMGNIVSMTTTIEQGFGSGIMVGGFMLNNELTDFSFQAESDGRMIANRVSGGKRPRSSMSPTIVFGTDHNPILAIGSPGGSRIIEYVASSLIAILDWQIPLKQALDLGHFGNRNSSSTELEADTDALHFKEALELLGHHVVERRMHSGLTAIQIHPDGALTSAVDRRRE